MAISAGRLTQMISVLNPVLTRNCCRRKMTEEWVFHAGKIHADIRGRSSRERMQSGAEMAQAEIRNLGARSVRSGNQRQRHDFMC